MKYGSGYIEYKKGLTQKVKFCDIQLFSGNGFTGTLKYHAATLFHRF